MVLHHSLRSFALILMTLCLGLYAVADPVSFSISPALLTASPGETVIFAGTITNSLGTGETLDAFSFFFDFNNFDVSALADPVQILPLNSVDFDIPDGTTSGIVELFSVTLLNTAVANQPYTLDVTLQAIDTSGNTLTGNTVTAGLTGQGTATTVPEPRGLLLLASGLATLLLCLPTKSWHSHVSQIA
jgi:hypothetical protein